MPEREAERPGPYRVVDRENQGWYRAGQPGGGTLYTASYGFQRDLLPRSYPELAATRGPLRPVEPVTDADVAEMEQLFTAAGRKTVTTLAAALAAVYHQAATGPDGAKDYVRARRTLTAGREGSWESEVLIDVMWFGSGLDASNPRRVHPATLGAMTDLLWRWVASPDRYTEVAETLASAVSRYCDEHGGWRPVADQWLQPGGLARADFSTCYRLLYSHSANFDSGVI